MAAIAYIIRRNPQGQWEYIYSHWGAETIYNYMYNTSITKLSFAGLTKVIMMLWHNETKKSGEEIHFLRKKPSEFINIRDITVDAWVIIDPMKYVVIYKPSKVNSPIPTGTLLMLSKKTPDSGRLIKLFLSAKEVALALGIALKDGYIDIQTANKIGMSYITRDSLWQRLNYVNIVVANLPLKARRIMDGEILGW